MFLFAWFPASVGKYQSYGVKWLASNRLPRADGVLVEWAARCERAHNNLKEFFPPFIVAILILGLMDKFDSGTRLAATLFVLARLGHFITYGMGHVLGRATFFFTGLFANLYLLIKILL